MHPEYPNLESHYRLDWQESVNVPVQPMSPDWKFPMFNAQLEGKDLDRFNRDLKDIVLQYKEQITEYTSPSRKSKAHHPNSDYDLTAAFEDWNFFYINHPAVECLFYYFKEATQEFANRLNMDPGGRTNILCWPNAIEHNDTMGEHSHQGDVEQTYMSGNYCVNASSDTATVFDTPGFNEQTITIGNNPGQLTLFPQWVSHWTTPFEREDDYRVTIAADVDVGSLAKYNYYSEFDETGHYLPLDHPPHEKARRHGESVSNMPGVDHSVVEFINTPFEDIKENDLVFDFEGH